jgi:hypothetical protein
MDAIAFLRERRRENVRAYAAVNIQGRGESPLAKFLIGGAVTIVFECW